MVYSVCRQGDLTASTATMLLFRIETENSSGNCFSTSSRFLNLLVVSLPELFASYAL